MRPAIKLAILIGIIAGMILVIGVSVAKADPIHRHHHHRVVINPGGPIHLIQINPGGPIHLVTP